MVDEFWISAIFGIITGGIYVLSGYVSLRLALKRSNQSLMMVVFGGMALRLFVAVSAIALIFALAPIDQKIFLAAFFVVFVIGLVLEISVLHRQSDTTKNASE